MNVVLAFALRKAGGRIALAKKLNISPQAISQWREVPVHRVLEIERITGLSRSDLRPDIYPPHDDPRSVA
ncbi:DNA-binding transcriptional regulator YdaS (Cro superfamily) [Pseudaminobacter salicylatoxidans]|uniref:DNA-binding transcriptional regulator YdaS (Cro superfamily) n=1 Tax=Pseudaminobacter salicylatoxidans TaxID=93369 RepID=A0A316BQV1_PSESE|nr:Cro/CI family transcriptional regulator [Pseudaminobacter salicylatoxidans]PWJ75265.1 DNA-binding transcriptional regulator YdaS (Cro superfamily) [Pseudaminobacter salicylatoxidans]